MTSGNGDDVVKLILVGINYRTAPVDLRECFSVPESTLSVVLQQLKDQTRCLETVLLSTCNRTEIFALVEDAALSELKIRGFLSTISGLPEQDFSQHLYRKEGIEAIRHMLRVVTGLDSMIVGETQILGQMKQAFLFAQAHEFTGSFFNVLFNRVIAFGKKVQAETTIGQSAVSVSYAAVALAKKVFDHLANKSVLVIGAGKMSELTLTHLTAQGVKDVWIANRTLARAKSVADRFRGQALTLTELKGALIAADIVITSTGASQPLLDVDTVNEAMRKRRMRPMFIIDIAVPRDVEAAVGKISGVYLYDIDDLQEAVAANVTMRQQEALRVEAWMEEELQAVRSWLREQEAVPLIVELRKRTTRIQEEVLDSLFHKLPDLTDHDRKVLQKHAQSIINQILKSPIENLKTMSTEPNGDEHLQTFARLFDLSYEPLSDRPNSITAVDASMRDYHESAVDQDREYQLQNWADGRQVKPLAAL